MYICDLINNPTFSFNAPIRIFWCWKDGKKLAVFDSTLSGDIHFDLMFKTISAIDIGGDGVLEITFSE